MERLRIEHGSGYLDLNVAAFFPCPVKKAVKVFRLINQWCSPEDRQALMDCFQDRAEEYKAFIASGEDSLRHSLMKRSDERDLLLRIQRNRRLLRRLNRNMELLEVG